MSVSSDPDHQRPAPSEAVEERRARRRWTAIIVSFLAFDVVAAAVLVFSARGDPSHYVERDYYKKALAWDETMARRRRAAELGWRLDVGVLATPAAGLVGVEVAVRDRLGEPVKGATVQMTAFHKARAGQRQVGTLAPTGKAGRHRGLIRRPRPGRWQLSFEITRGEDRVIETVDREIAATRRPDRPGAGRP